MNSRTGIDRLLGDPEQVRRLQSARTGLLSHDACRTLESVKTRHALARALGISQDQGLVRLFTPEHGLAATAAAGDAIGDSIDTETGVPVVSLYGTRLQPDSDMLADLDIVLIDLRDVGVRCFTYAATAARLLAVAATLGTLDVIVCDRPNPLGPSRAGPRLDPAFRSLIAWFDVPFIHGRTIGELLQMAAAETAFDRLEIIAADNTGGCEPDQPWVSPSPALDHPHAVRLYPGLVLLEGTNLSEGRGTPVPFRSIAAPWLDTKALAHDIADWRMPVSVTPTTLTPATGDHAGETLPALAFDLPDNDPFDSLSFGVHLLSAIARRHPEFSWTAARNGGVAVPGEIGPGYVIDALLGSRSLRQAIDHGDSAAAILENWRSR